MATAHTTPTPKHMDTLFLPFYRPHMFPLLICFMQSHYSTLTQTTLASYLKALTTNGSSMSCQSPLPESLLGAGAEGLASPPWSVDSSERCEEHEESLSVFCLDDLEPLCKQCAAASHTGHRVYPLTEAATDCKVGSVTKTKTP